MRESFKKVAGRRVVATDTAENIGSVKGMSVDPTAHRIEAIHVQGRGSRADLLGWDAIESFGADAVMASTAAAVHRVGNDHERQAVTHRITPLGRRVLTTGGVEVGTVDDVEFDGDTGNVMSIVTTQGSISVERVRSLGSYALVVDEPSPPSSPAPTHG